MFSCISDGGLKDIGKWLRRLKTNLYAIDQNESIRITFGCHLINTPNIMRYNNNLLSSIFAFVKESGYLFGFASISVQSKLNFRQLGNFRSEFPGWHHDGVYYIAH